MIKRTIHLGNPAHLYTRNRQMLIDFKTEERSTASIPIEDLGVVILEHPHITLSTSLLELLMSNKVAVITCDSKYMPCGLLLPLEGNTEQSEKFRIQIAASKPLKKQLWQQTIKAKIYNQGRILEDLNLGSKRLYNLSEKVTSGDAKNLEAQAASFYWSELYGSAFIRLRNSAAPNAQLNYGYAILRSVVARALISSGLLPTLGIHHKNKYNAYCLADDIMEPYRPYVDKIVLTMSNLEFTQEGLTKEQKIELLKLPQYDVFIGDLKRPLFHAVSMTTASLYKCFSGETRRIVYPVLK